MRLRLFSFLGIQVLVKIQNAWPDKSHSELEKVQSQGLSREESEKEKLKLLSWSYSS